MILITTFYKSSNEKRQKEIEKCLLKNFENPCIEKIYLLNNELYDLDIYKTKVEQVIINSNQNYKLKYSDAIKFINENLNGNICILSNSDIYFDESLSKIGFDNIKDSFYALLRYDEDSNGDKQIFRHFDEARSDSQDSWIFESPLQIDYNEIDFEFGTLGCDNIFASKVHESGFLKVSNPCYDIISTHVHMTNHRTYDVDNRIHGNYCLIKPSKLFDNKELLFKFY
jgi:hypothetical protein